MIYIIWDIRTISGLLTHLNLCFRICDAIIIHEMFGCFAALVQYVEGDVKAEEDCDSE